MQTGNLSCQVRQSTGKFIISFRAREGKEEKVG